MLGPIMKNDAGKEAAILYFRLIDSTGEIGESGAKWLWGKMHNLVSCVTQLH
jgi:hypothetical protein